MNLGVVHDEDIAALEPTNRDQMLDIGGKRGRRSVILAKRVVHGWLIAAASNHSNQVERLPVVGLRVHLFRRNKWMDGKDNTNHARLTFLHVCTVVLAMMFLFAMRNCMTSVKQ
jgi:hypothetical protein